MPGRIIRCVGRRRLTVSTIEDKVVLTIWFRDPPQGHQIAGLQLEKAEVEKLLLELTEVVANG